ncbi:TP901 family phage tail tape measure protein [Azospirillum fermentarium]|uniref:phage tail tape measure protein n=1 Tax=Azospirillum fermentarium TaxID=1233114 RepID=UPI002227234A|nr:phage tail tape measure protein [Azospirillum fermentarium]MCW2248308.1 TP901 family phage tail tape measure protein [Azospirillum fermentarium]
MANGAGPSVLVTIGGKVASSLGTAISQVKNQVGSLERSIRIQTRANEQNRAALRGQMVDAFALGASLNALVKPAIEFESAMADVRKVVEFKDGAAGLQAMGKSIKELSREIPISQAGLAAIVAAGGRMGIAEDDLLSYTRTVAKMSTAWEMPPEIAGESMGKIANIMGLSINQIERVSDAINSLDDSSTAKASEIVDVLKRTGGVAKQFGLTTQQAAALSTAMLDLGSSPEVAATGINALLNKMQSAPAQSKKFQEALGKLGWTAKGMQKAIAKDAQGTLNKFLEQLSTLDKIPQADILAELFGAEYSDDMAKLVGGMDKYKQHLKLVSTEANYAGSMQKEFAIRTETAKNQLEIASNLTREMAINTGSALLPGIVSVLKAMGPYVTSLAEFAERHPMVIKGVVGTAVALAGLKIAVIGTGYAWTFVKGAALTTSSVLVKSAGVAATATRLAFLPLTGLGSLVYRAAVQARIGLELLQSGSITTGQFLTGMFTGLGRGFLNLGAMFRMGSIIIRAALISTGIGAIMVGVGMAVAWVMNNTENLTIAWEAFKGAFDRAIAPVRPAVDAIAGPLSDLWDWITTLVGPVDGLGGGFAAFGIKAGNAVGGLVVAIVNFVSNVGSWFSTAWNSVKEATTSGWSSIRDTVGAAIDNVIGRFIAVTTAFDQGVIQGIIALFQNFSPVALVAEGINAVVAYLTGIDLSASGAAIIDTIVQGVKAKASALVDAVKETLASVREYLPFSDAKRGPLSTLTYSGKALVGTIGEGVQMAGAPALSGPLAAAFGGALATLSSGAANASATMPAVAGVVATDVLAGATSAGTAAIAGASPARGVSVSAPITITVNGNADPAAIADQVRDALERLIGDAESARRSALHD